MANGDAAAAKGWDVVAENDDHGEGYDAINYALDKVANEIDARTAADALKFDASNVIISASTPAVVNGAIWLKPL